MAFLAALPEIAAVAGEAGGAEAAAGGAAAAGAGAEGAGGAAAGGGGGGLFGRIGGMMRDFNDTPVGQTLGTVSHVMNVGHGLHAVGHATTGLMGPSTPSGGANIGSWSQAT